VGGSYTCLAGEGLTDETDGRAQVLGTDVTAQTLSLEAGCDYPVVDGITAAVYQIPTDQPEADGTLAWTSTTLVIANVSGGGRTGLGYTYGSGACKPLIEGELAAAVTGHDVFGSGAAVASMVAAVRNLGRPGIASYAISAVETALWDLKGILLGLPVSSLLGAVRDTVPVYGSGGFTTYDDPAARTQLEHWTGDLEIPRVKIKVGESWGSAEARDLARIAFARNVIGPDAELYVDANGGYTRKQAVRMAHAMAPYGVTWFEEPVSSDDLDGLREVRDQVDPDVTAGEYGYDLPYFGRMVDAGAVDCLQVDVTRCGGITEWLRAAAVAAAKGLQVSGHCAPNLHAHVAAAVPNLRHLEYFHDHVRIETMLFDGALDPTGGTLRPDKSRPGLGLTLKEPNAAPYRVA
jgi:L-alanine-DL-glutamate epimerase-like enolase superfamily enzyme